MSIVGCDGQIITVSTHCWREEIPNIIENDKFIKEHLQTREDIHVSRGTCTTEHQVKVPCLASSEGVSDICLDQKLISCVVVLEEGDKVGGDQQSALNAVQ